VDVAEVLNQRKALSSEFVELLELLFRSEGIPRVSEIAGVILSEEQQAEARREMNRRGGMHEVLGKLKVIQTGLDRIAQNLRAELRKNGLKSILHLLDAALYEELLVAVERIELLRVAPERRRLGALPAGIEPEVKAIVREFGGGKYQVTYPALGGVEERREVLEFGGPSRDLDLSDLLSRWGLRTEVEEARENP
jgi:hypothetical protein